MSGRLKQPMFWAWFLVTLWGCHSLYTLFMGRWTGLVISMVGLLAALLIVSAIQSRRHKNLNPDIKQPFQQIN
jgi:uncharacterized membrane protein YjjP (DUF1212 family)